MRCRKDRRQFADFQPAHGTGVQPPLEPTGDATPRSSSRHRAGRSPSDETTSIDTATRSSSRSRDTIFGNKTRYRVVRTSQRRRARRARSSGHGVSKLLNRARARDSLDAQSERQVRPDSADAFVRWDECGDRGTDISAPSAPTGSHARTPCVRSRQRQLKRRRLAAAHECGWSGSLIRAAGLRRTGPRLI